MGLSVLALSGCSPTLDWRDVRSPDGELVALFPCKPKSQDRQLNLADVGWSARLQVCDVQGLTFAMLSLTAVPLPGESAAASATALGQLRASAAERWGPSTDQVEAPAGVRLPHGLPAHWQQHSRRAEDGREVLTQALFLARGQHLHQLSVSGPRLDPAVLDSFFGQLRTLP